MKQAQKKVNKLYRILQGAVIFGAISCTSAHRCRAIQLMCLPPWFCNGFDFFSNTLGNALGHTLQEETMLEAAVYSF